VGVDVDRGGGVRVGVPVGVGSGVGAGVGGNNDSGGTGINKRAGGSGVVNAGPGPGVFASALKQPAVIPSPSNRAAPRIDRRATCLAPSVTSPLPPSLLTSDF